jgi:hypothetical protein
LKMRREVGCKRAWRGGSLAGAYQALLSLDVPGIALGTDRTCRYCHGMA